MNKKIHTIVCDLDGTLLNEKNEISKFNLSIIQRTIDLGIQFIIATGRRYFCVLPYLSLFQGKIQVIANNGQILKEYPENTSIVENFLKNEIVRVLYQKIIEEGFFPVLNVDWLEKEIDLILQESSCYVERYINNPRAMIISNLEQINLDRVTVVYTHAKDIQALYSLALKLQPYIQQQNLRILMTKVPNLGPCLEILPENISKWTGVEIFLQRNNQAPDGVLAFGDEANDLEMIQKSGLGVAMKNAILELKKNAKIVSSYSNSEDGVGKMIQKIIFSKS